MWEKYFKLYQKKKIDLEISNKDNIFGTIDHIYVSDNLCQKKIKKNFLKDMKFLEQESIKNKNYQHTNNQILNLIHPSMYCLIKY